MKINPGNARGLLVPQGDRPFSFVVYSSEIRDFGLDDGRVLLAHGRAPKALQSAFCSVGIHCLIDGLKLLAHGRPVFMRDE